MFLFVNKYYPLLNGEGQLLPDSRFSNEDYIETTGDKSTLFNCVLVSSFPEKLISMGEQIWY
jgi:hypothetical protein